MGHPRGLDMNDIRVVCSSISLYLIFIVSLFRKTAKTAKQHKICVSSPGLDPALRNRQEQAAAVLFGSSLCHCIVCHLRCHCMLEDDFYNKCQYSASCNMC